MPTKMEAAIKAALQAGELLKNQFRTDLEIREKSPSNLVTEVDLQSEKLILASLKSAFPEIPALSEEADLIHGRTPDLNAGSSIHWMGPPTSLMDILFLRFLLLLRRTTRWFLGLSMPRF